MMRSQLVVIALALSVLSLLPLMNSCATTSAPVTGPSPGGFIVLEQFEPAGSVDAQELLFLIRQLPPATQLVFNLHVIEGYPHKEIAELLNMREGTSKWHVNEARKQLQKKLQLLAAAS